MQEITVKRRNVQKAAEGQRQFVVTRAFRHEGELYVRGDVLACSPELAERWVAIECLDAR